MDAQSRDKEVSHKLEAFQKLTSTLGSRDDPLVEVRFSRPSRRHDTTSNCVHFFQDQIPVRDDSNFRRVANNAMNSHQHFGEIQGDPHDVIVVTFNRN